MLYCEYEHCEQVISGNVGFQFAGVFWMLLVLCKFAKFVRPQSPWLGCLNTNCLDGCSL